MKCRIFTFFLVAGILGFAGPAWAQVPGASCHNCPPPPVQRNGNDTLGMSYNASQCGLNFVQSSVPLIQRSVAQGWPAGQVQPATFPITGIPSCATILKAFLYTDASGDGSAFTASITNPLGGNASYPMTLIGSAPDKCWSSVGFLGTFSYRADVTASITGNGNYLISGLPVSSFGPNDVDGATLIIIYADPTATYTGTIAIADGADVFAVTTTPTDLITGFNACATSNTATAFAIVADLQSLGNFDIGLNSNTINLSYPAASQFWWDFMSTPTTVNAGQTTAPVIAFSTGDCYNLLVAGLYFQTSCTTCTPVNVGTQLNASADTSICSGQSVQLNVTGGNTYTWTPAAGLSNPNIANPVATPTVTTTYIVSSGNCTLPDTVTITVNPSPVITVNSDTVCSGQPVTLTANGASTYVWSTGDSINPITVHPLATTTYTVTGTSTAGCTATATALVSTFFSVNAGPDATICPGGQAQLNVLPVGPVYTYTWTPAASLNNAAIPNPIAAPTATTSYIVSVSDGGFCTGTDTVTVFISNQIPVAGFTYDPPVPDDLHTLIDFNNTSIGAVTYQWDLGICGTSSNANTYCLFPADTGTYCVRLIVANAMGCKDTNIQCLVIQEAYTVYIPNTFTPNLDGHNEFFRVEGRGIRNLEAHIFNRWGAEIFTFYNNQPGWNGSMVNGEACSLGVYCYRIYILDVFGGEHTYTGHINLIR